MRFTVEWLFVESLRNQHLPALLYHHNTAICTELTMKTTLNIDDNLLAEAKAQAVRERTTLTRLVEEGLNLRMRSRARVVRAGRSALPLLRGTGALRAGIDPTSNRSLFEAAGDDDA